MDWIASIWSKINKPLSYLSVGVALLLFAPSELKWPGYVFLAMGIAGSLEWSGSKIRDMWAKRRQLARLCKDITTLNDEEKELLYRQVDKGEQTFYMDPFRVRNQGGIPEYVRLASLHRGLLDKGILDISAATADGKVTTLHVTHDAWELLIKDLQEKRRQRGK